MTPHPGVLSGLVSFDGNWSQNWKNIKYVRAVWRKVSVLTHDGLLLTLAGPESLIEINVTHDCSMAGGMFTSSPSLSLESGFDGEGDTFSLISTASNVLVWDWLISRVVLSSLASWNKIWNDESLSLYLSRQPVFHFEELSFFLFLTRCSMF